MYTTGRYYKNSNKISARVFFLKSISCSVFVSSSSSSSFTYNSVLSNRIILHFNHICLSKVRSVLILNSLLNLFSILSKALCNRLSLLLAQLHTSAYYYFIYIYICVYTFIQIVRLLNEICVCVCVLLDSMTCVFFSFVLI